MKSIFYFLALSILFIPSKSFSQCPENFHDFSALDIHGNTIDMSTFAGKKLLVVNTASFCGYTPQADAHKRDGELIRTGFCEDTQ